MNTLVLWLILNQWLYIIQKRVNSSLHKTVKLGSALRRISDH